MHVVRRLVHGHGAALAIAALVSAAAAGLALVQPLMAGRIVDAASHASLTTQLAALLAAAFTAQIGDEAASRYLFDRLGETIVLAQRRRYADHLIELPVADLDQQRVGDLLARATADTTQLHDLPRCLTNLAIGLCTLGVAVYLMLRIDVILALIIVTIVAVSFAGGTMLLAKVQDAAGSRQEAIGEYGARLERTLSAIRTVKVCGAQHLHSDSIGQAAVSAQQAGLRLARLGALATPVVRLAVTGSLVVVLVVGGTRVASGTLSIGGMVSLFLFTLYALGPLQDVYDGLTSIRTAVGANERIAEILRRPTEPLTQPCPLPSPPEVARRSQNETVLSANNIGFSYGCHHVLHNVSFRILDNQVTALVGPSGSGKSTLLALLCRFYDPTTGELTFNERPYSSYQLDDLRRQIALVEQDNPVLYGSLRDNITMANPNATDGQIWATLAHVNLDETVKRLPDGLDSNVLDHGRGLSGGQRQRLAIARALLSPAQLILLDEPTAHLDRVNEYTMMNALMAHRDQRSLLVVAHRISTVQQADQILVMDNGQILTHGTHDQLLEQSADYRRLVQHGFENPTTAPTSERRPQDQALID